MNILHYLFKVILISFFILKCSQPSKQSSSGASGGDNPYANALVSTGTQTAPAVDNSGYVDPSSGDNGNQDDSSGADNSNTDNSSDSSNINTGSIGGNPSATATPPPTQVQSQQTLALSNAVVPLKLPLNLLGGTLSNTLLSTSTSSTSVTDQTFEGTAATSSPSLAQLACTQIFHPDDQSCDGKSEGEHLCEKPPVSRYWHPDPTHASGGTCDFRTPMHFACDNKGVNWMMQNSLCTAATSDVTAANTKCTTQGFYFDTTKGAGGCTNVSEYDYECGLQGFYLDPTLPEGQSCTFLTKDHYVAQLSCGDATKYYDATGACFDTKNQAKCSAINYYYDAQSDSCPYPTVEQFNCLSTNAKAIWDTTITPPVCYKTANAQTCAQQSPGMYYDPDPAHDECKYSTQAENDCKMQANYAANYLWDTYPSPGEVIPPEDGFVTPVSYCMRKFELVSLTNPAIVSDSSGCKTNSGEYYIIADPDPQINQHKFCALGQSVTSNAVAASIPAIPCDDSDVNVAYTLNSNPVFIHPARWQSTINDTSCTNPSKPAAYSRPVPPTSNYVCFGEYAALGHDTTPNLNNYWCIHAHYVESISDLTASGIPALFLLGLAHLPAIGAAFSKGLQIPNLFEMNTNGGMTSTYRIKSQFLQNGGRRNIPGY